MRNAAWCAAVIAGLVACKGGSKPDPQASAGSGSGSGSGSAVVTDAAPRRESADAPMTDAATFSTTISSAGVGPLDAKTPNDLAAIQQRFPGLTVEVEHNEGEAYSVDEYTIKRADKPALFVIVDLSEREPRIFRIDVTDPTFEADGGIHVGSTVAELAAKHADATCRFDRYDPGDDVYGVDKRLYCTVPSLPNVAFDLDPSTWRGKPAKIAWAKLGAQKLSVITWLAPPE